MVQLLELCASIAASVGLIPAQGTKILQVAAVWPKKTRSINFHHKNSHIDLARHYIMADAFCNSSVVSILKYTTTAKEW